MLEIRSITKKYGEKVAVDNLSLTIEAGDIYGFIGHNGAGKTTTLKACCGILRPDEGDILIDGISVIDSPIEAKRIIAYIPDDPKLYDYLTGIQYLNFICDVYGVKSDLRQQRINKYAEMLEIKDDLAKSISEYSHGMKQKLAVISGLVHNPKVFLMDEPFVGLDPKASFMLKNLMKEHCREGGAIFFSTHVLEVAQKLCNKISIIKSGKLIVSGNIDDVVGDRSLEDVFMNPEEGNNA
ncbi:MAG: ABC transporter ATP-binding protein [Clostridiales bacterium]|nr:ABC transporter ATP-binding protein [Clostridiales bacterium]